MRRRSISVATGPGFSGVHCPYIVGFNGDEAIQDARAGRRGEASARSRAAPRPGEFKAPLQPANFDGPGAWRFLCLDHVREHNAKYNFFEGMSAEEIHGGASARSAGGSGRAASSPPTAPTRRHGGATLPIRWTRSPAASAGSATTARTRGSASPNGARLSVLGLGEDADRNQLRKRYSGLVRRYHPDKNGGDRSARGQAGRGDRGLSAARKSAAFA